MLMNSNKYLNIIESIKSEIKSTTIRFAVDILKKLLKTAGQEMSWYIKLKVIYMPVKCLLIRFLTLKTAWFRRRVSLLFRQ